MYSYEKVLNGLTKYIDDEIVNKLPGWKKWVVGSGIGIMLSNADNVFNQIKSNEFVKMLNLVDEQGRINVEEIYKELKKQAQNSSASIELPMVGAFVLNEQDVDKLYHLITSEQ